MSSEHLLIFSVATGTPDMDSLRREFRSIESTQRGPYFRGYCGEHASEHCGVVQLAGSSPAEQGNCHPILLFINSTFWFIGLFPSDFGARERNRDRLDEEARRMRATIVRSRPASTAYTRIRGRRNATATPSTVQTLDFGGPLIREQEVIDRLQVGEGVSGTEMADLFEKCTLCGHYFIASLLRLHIRACAPDL